ncbi:MAG: hypothetical protein DBX93_04960 [Oscillospiraceae bacterium]|nr:MAG: hypothetical protein DBX93_04960 [Oscillospiraceae bacterium]
MKGNQDMKKNKVFYKAISLILLTVSTLSFPANVAAASIVPQTVTGSEHEPNNTFATAQIMHSDYTLTGYINSAGDVDYYQVTFPVSGYASFWLGNIPSSMDLDLFIYNQSRTQIASSTGNGNAELISNVAVTAGQKYYIKVESFHADLYDASNPYLIRTKVQMNSYAYFSQNPTNFSTTNLEKTYTSYDSSDWKSLLTNTGCVICGYAMILNNLGATLTEKMKDVRTANSNGDMTDVASMEADPYSVMLAACNITNSSAITYSNGRFNIAAKKDPMRSAIATVSEKFGTNYKLYKFTSGSKTATYKKQLAAYLVAEHPQGIGLYFSNGSSMHLAVLTESSYTVGEDFVPMSPTSSTALGYSEELEQNSESFNMQPTAVASDAALLGTKAATTIEDGDKFIIYDPYHESTSKGDGILLSNSYTGKVYTWDDLYTISVFY